jgi:hypothetical protein
LKESLTFMPGPTLDHNPFSVSCTAGMASGHHQAWVIG